MGGSAQTLYAVVFLGAGVLAGGVALAMSILHELAARRGRFDRP